MKNCIWHISENFECLELQQWDISLIWPMHSVHNLNPASLVSTFRNDNGKEALAIGTNHQKLYIIILPNIRTRVQKSCHKVSIVK